MLSHIHEFYPKCHATSLFLPHILQLLASCYFIKHMVTYQCQTRKAEVLQRFFSFNGRLWQTGVCIEVCDAKNFKKLQLLLEYKNAYSNPGLSCYADNPFQEFQEKINTGSQCRINGWLRFGCFMCKPLLSDTETISKVWIPLKVKMMKPLVV